MIKVSDVAKGWNGDAQTLLVGSLVALPFSGLLTVVISLVADIPASLLVVVVGAFQLVLGLGIAGRLGRRS